ncbi:hypothetical protein H2248_005800 [Termitomyces sp. 'cryptogamus']|nr:hypothetical protein H2248_005800 [Termitomyces sp. 'cryptogamus']
MENMVRWFYKTEGWDVLLSLLKNVYEPLLAMVSSRLDEDTRPEDTFNRYHGRRAKTPTESREILVRTRRRTGVRNKENRLTSNGGRSKQFAHDEESIPRSLTLLERVDGTLNSRAATEQPSLLSRLDPHPDPDFHGPYGLLTRMGLSAPGGPYTTHQRSSVRRRRARR